MQYLTLIPCRTSLRSCYLVWYLAGYTFDFLVRYAVSYRAAAAWHCKKDRERFSAHFIIHSFYSACAVRGHQVASLG